MSNEYGGTGKTVSTKASAWKIIALVSIVLNVALGGFLLWKSLARNSAFAAFPTGTFKGGSVGVEFKNDGTGRWFATNGTWEVPIKYAVSKDLYTEMAFDWPEGVQAPATYYWTYKNGALSFKLWGEDMRPHRQQVMDGRIYIKKTQ